MKKVSLHYSIIIVFLLAFMLGLIKELIIISLALTIHETGHILCLRFFKYKINKIVFYPFGGIINHELKNDFLYKIIIISLGGILLNLLFCFLFKFIGFKTASNLNLIMALVNIVPIYPLDGGRVLICLLCYVFPYRISKLLTYIISIALSVLFAIYFWLNLEGIYLIFMMLVFVKINIMSTYNLTKEYRQFMLLKHLYPNSLFKEKITSFWTINPENNLFYGKKMVFKYDELYLSEAVLLNKHFK